MRLSIRLPAGPNTRWSQTAAEQLVGARLYEGDKREREVGYVVSVRRYNRGSVVLAEIELHDRADQLLVEMRGFNLGASLLPESTEPRP